MNCRVDCWVGVLLPLILVTLTAAGRACDCLPAPPVKDALKDAAAVFSGKVTAMKVGGHVVVTFDVETAWKGVEGKTITISTATAKDTCGYTFEMGKSYLVYAYLEGEGVAPSLRTNICTRTKPLEKALNDLKELGVGKAP